MFLEYSEELSWHRSGPLRSELAATLEGQAKETADGTGIAVDGGIVMTNHPNPFNPTAQINYQLPYAAHMSLKIYDILGRLVATLVDGVIDAGYHTATFDGSKLSSGVYFARADITPLDGSKPLTLTRKLLLTK